MASDELGKIEIANIREYIQRVERGFEELGKSLQVIREWQIRAEEQQKYYVTDTSLHAKIAPIESKLQALEQKQPGYLQSATVAEKIIGIAIGIGIAVLTAFLTSLMGK